MRNGDDDDSDDNGDDDEEDHDDDDDNDDDDDDDDEKDKTNHCLPLHSLAITQCAEQIYTAVQLQITTSLEELKSGMSVA